MTVPAAVAALADAQADRGALSCVDHRPPWPDRPDAAFHGPAGDLALIADPHTEADPVAVLVSVLVALAVALGRVSGFTVGGIRHYLTEYVAIVGDTGAGRKGQSAGPARMMLQAVAPDLAIASGLASGEGLIDAVRDEVRRPSKPGKGKPSVMETVDPGVTDKRLLVLESELGHALRVMGRDGSTLSTQLRIAWDCVDSMKTLAKGTPRTATGAHIGVIGHITEAELHQLLGTTDVLNGLANRFLWVAARRSKLLPDGGQLHRVNLSELWRDFRQAVEYGRRQGELDRDDGAAELWHEVYGSVLTAHRPGLFGAATGRAEAHTARLACLYAILDRSAVVTVEHLQAALALNRYSMQSARRIFGDRTGDPTADTILDAVRESPEGLTMTDIRDLFHRNASPKVKQAISALRSHGLIETKKEPTRGRPTTRIVAAKEIAP